MYKCKTQNHFVLINTFRLNYNCKILSHNSLHVENAWSYEMGSKNNTEIFSIETNGTYFMQEYEGEIEKILWRILPPMLLTFGTLGNFICGKI